MAAKSLWYFSHSTKNSHQIWKLYLSHKPFLHSLKHISHPVCWWIYWHFTLPYSFPLLFKMTHWPRETFHVNYSVKADKNLTIPFSLPCSAKAILLVSGSSLERWLVWGDQFWVPHAARYYSILPWMSLLLKRSRETQTKSIKNKCTTLQSQLAFSSRSSVVWAVQPLKTTHTSFYYISFNREEMFYFYSSFTDLFSKIKISVLAASKYGMLQPERRYLQQQKTKEEVCLLSSLHISPSLQVKTTAPPSENMGTNLRTKYL